jgi:hypothetical protein
MCLSLTPIADGFAMSFKRCFKCLLELPLSAFYKHAQMGDGHLNKCKECTKKDDTATRLARIEHYRQYDRQRASMPHRLQKNREITARWREKNPDRRRAQIMVGNAVRDGKLTPEPCFICGTPAEAHHPDYTQPLDVVWLCPPHHKQAHALLRRIAA